MKSEYTDMKAVKHSVEHLTLPADDKDNRERILEELLHALTKTGKRLPD